ncbi:hypothetical protein [Thalassotalea agarivorans]|uniref:Uncharacterized protein n=1 Tax=Thalassotalea agarivorans TaxID=349064 RepID=A0A1I0BMW9_THASX|nr:hypothetical protein [Thalassotalea agarivorans]SET07611.1 hypothetical protein SAMN05660429_00984 [Thalassotalea agarivorans]
MKDKQTIRILKMIMIFGICLFVVGHMLISYLDLPQKLGVMGMVIGASCMALGLVLSLPTKMYLTFLWMKKENTKDKNIKSEYKD